MEVVTIQKYIHTSPRKLRLLADMVRKLNPEKALDVLRITPKSAADPLAKAIKTILANAKIQGMGGVVTFKSIEVNESMKMRRMRAGSRGRAKSYKRRMSHIKIVLTDDLNVKTQNSKVKTEKAELKNSKNTVGMDDSAAKTTLKKGGEVKK